MIAALHDNIILKRNKPEERKTPGGIIIAASNSAQDTAVVIDIGPLASEDMEEFPHSKLMIGDNVIITRLTGSDISIDGEQYVIVSFSDILAIHRPDAEKGRDAKE